MSSLSLALDHGYSLFAALSKNVVEWYGEIGGDQRDPIGSLPFSKLGVPPELAWTAQRAEGRPGRLTERLMRSWMERITSYGFRRIPRARGRAGVQRGGAVRANPISPILHWKFNGELLIAANGKTISVAYDREIVRMLGRVSQGNVCAPAQLTRVGSGKAGCAPRRAARRSLEFLMEERALVRV